MATANDPSAAPAAAFQYRKPIRGHLVWWLRWLGVAAFVILLLRLTRYQPLVLMRKADIGWLGWCMGLAMVQLLLEALVWQWLLSIQRVPHRYGQTAVAYLASQYLGLVTPGHVGEFLAAGYISMNTGITFGYALSSVVMKKLLNWVVIISVGLWGLRCVSAFPVLRGVGWVIAATAVVVAILAAGISIWVVSLRRLTRKWERLSPWKIETPALRAGLQQLLSVKLLIPLWIAALAFSCLFFQLDAVLRSVGVSLPFLVVAQTIAFSRLVARVIPVSVLGFGSKDAALIWMLAQHGVSTSVGLTAALLLLLTSYLITLLVSALCWWLKPLVVRRAQPASS